jgi:hypothetical protein
MTTVYQPLDVQPSDTSEKSHLQLQSRTKELKLLRGMITDKRRYVFATVRARVDGIDHFDISGLALLLY